MDEKLFSHLETITKGKKKIGQVWKHIDSGLRFYVATLGQRDIFRCGEATISEATRKGVACWQFNDETIISMRVRKIDVLAIKVRETGDQYFIRFADALKRPSFRLKGVTDEAYATKRFIPLSRCWLVPGAVKKLS